MEFESANPSVVRSVKQRDLLNSWLRARGKYRGAARCSQTTGPTASRTNWRT